MTSLPGSITTKEGNGSPRKRARSELASGAANGGGGRAALPRTDDREGQPNMFGWCWRSMLRQAGPRMRGPTQNALTDLKCGTELAEEAFYVHHQADGLETAAIG